MPFNRYQNYVKALIELSDVLNVTIEGNLTKEFFTIKLTFRLKLKEGKFLINISSYFQARSE